MSHHPEYFHCSYCGQAFSEWTMDTAQSHGCATNVVDSDQKSCAYSGYGSSFDGNKWVGEVFSGHDGGEICDVCLETFWLLGLTHVEHDHFGNESVYSKRRSLDSCNLNQGKI